jgi:superfamily I DNA/RNA helicase
VDKEFSSKGHVGLVRVHGQINSVEIRHGEDTLLLGRTHSILREVEQMLIEKRIPYVRESGRPGAYQNKYAAAIRAYRKLSRGERLSDSERGALFGVATESTRKSLEINDYANIVKNPFYMVLNIPQRVIEFYEEADLESDPTIRLSTIHAAKGHEADRVILLTDMTTRVSETADRSPDDECRVWYVGMTRAKHTLDIVEGYNGYRL